MLTWRGFVYAIIVALIGTTCTSAQTVTDFRETVTYIASDECAGRETASDGLYRAQQYIATQLREAGLDPRYQEIQTRQGKCRNLIAYIQGASDKYILVGAHLDHIGQRRFRRQATIYNGADDNASGSAVVLAMALRLKQLEKISLVPQRHSVVFVWFTGEEHGFWGSEYFAKNPIAPCKGECTKCDKLPIFMLNLDMVGRLKGFDRIYKEDTLPVNDILKRLYDRYAFGASIVYRDGGADSDHYPFHKRGVPYVLLHTGLHPDYHEPTDTADKINYDGMLKVTHFALDLLDEVMRADEVEYNLINGELDD